MLIDDSCLVGLCSGPWFEYPWTSATCGQRTSPVTSKSEKLEHFACGISREDPACAIMISPPQSQLLQACTCVLDRRKALVGPEGLVEVLSAPSDHLDIVALLLNASHKSSKL